jgi:hypothetical protein
MATTLAREQRDLLRALEDLIALHAHVNEASPRLPGGRRLLLSIDRNAQHSQGTTTATQIPHAIYHTCTRN